MMTLRTSLAVALGVIVAAPAAYAVPLSVKPTPARPVIAVEDRHEIAEERERCRDLRHEEHEVRERLARERDREDRERLEARLHEIRQHRERVCRD